MAKAVTTKIKLLSSADTGFYYVTKKNSRTMTDKLVMKKYDPIAQEARRVPRDQDQVIVPRIAETQRAPSRAPFCVCCVVPSRAARLTCFRFGKKGGRPGAMS